MIEGVREALLGDGQVSRVGRGAGGCWLALSLDHGLRGPLLPLQQGSQVLAVRWALVGLQGLTGAAGASRVPMLAAATRGLLQGLTGAAGMPLG